jgi:hypothetical protein
MTVLLIDSFIQTLLSLAVIFGIYSTVQLHRGLPSATDPKYPEEYRRVRHKTVVNTISWSNSQKSLARIRIFNIRFNF